MGSSRSLRSLVMTCGHLLDDGTEEPVLRLETILVFMKEPLEIVKKHPVKHCVLRMTLPVNPCHGREDDS